MRNNLDARMGKIQQPKREQPRSAVRDVDNVTSKRERERSEWRPIASAIRRCRRIAHIPDLHRTVHSDVSERSLDFHILRKLVAYECYDARGTIPVRYVENGDAPQRAGDQEIPFVLGERECLWRSVCGAQRHELRAARITVVDNMDAKRVSKVGTRA